MSVSVQEKLMQARSLVNELQENRNREEENEPGISRYEVEFWRVGHWMNRLESSQFELRFDDLSPEEAQLFILGPAEDQFMAFYVKDFTVEKEPTRYRLDLDDLDAYILIRPLAD